MLNINEKEQAIKELLEDLDDNELFAVHNEFCEEGYYYDDQIYENSEEEFNRENESKTPFAIAESVYYGDYNPRDSYYILDGYANIKSGDLRDFVLFDDIAYYVVENDNSLGNSEIQDLLDEWADEEAEENNEEDDE